MELATGLLSNLIAAFVGGVIGFVIGIGYGVFCAYSQYADKHSRNSPNVEAPKEVEHDA